MNVPLPPSPSTLIALADGGARGASLALVGLVGAALAGLAAAAVVATPVADRPRPRVEGSEPAPPAPQVALAAPARLREGDQVEVEVRLRWEQGPPGGLERCLVEVLAEGEGLQVGQARAAGWVEGRAFLWVVPVEAVAPGEARLRAEARPDRLDRAREAAAIARVQVVPAGRQVTLVTNVEVAGPESALNVQLDPRARELQAPRSLAVRTLPGLTAEVQLGLEGLARMPHGCFEQTTAATYPSVLTLELAAERDDVPEELRATARACALAGAERLQRFQLEDGAFSIHGPPEPADPWLTAVGLEQRALLARALDLPPDRTVAAARALVKRWQEPSGAFRAEGRAAAAGQTVITAYAATALLASGEQPEAARAALAWLARRAEAQDLAPYELALAARALLRDGEHAAAGRALAARLVALAVRDEAGLASWPSGETTTRTAPAVSQVEVTALAAQALIVAGLHLDLATAALQWLAARRAEDGFGGTQATVQALHAFHTGHSLRRAGQGVLELDVGGWRSGPIEVRPAAGLETHLLEPRVEDALAWGVGLRFAGAGRIGAQLVLTGVVPWEEERWAAGAHEVEAAALRVRTERPARGRVGEAQRWVVHVQNTAATPVRDPMVEVGLPPGFVLEGADGGLEALRAERALHLWELGHERLVLYVRELAPGERLRLPVSLVPTLAGDFGAGHLQAYPYYRPGAAAATAPGQVQVLPPRGLPPATPPRTRGAAPRAAPLEPATAAAEAAPATPPAPTEAAPGADAPGTLTIAWDPGLGPLDLAAADLPAGTGPLARLVARALFRGLPSAADVVVVRPDQELELFLAPHRRWSDGRPLTVDDYLAAWSDARARAREHAADLQVDPAQLALLAELEAEVLGPFRVRLRVPRPVPGLLERLDAWPFLPRAPFPDPEGRPVTNGAYRVLEATPERLLLGRGGEDGPADLLEVRAGWTGAETLAWTEPRAREGAVPLDGLVVLPRGGRRLPADLSATTGWLPPGRAQGVALPEVPAITRADDGRLAALGDVAVRRARGDEEAAALLPSHLVAAGTLDARRALDRSGWLRHPAVRPER